ncbi:MULTISPECIES: phosphoribosylglycinamide formyltransferase [Corynebacterium]|uniref:phosphoribosylglycinamide formyltransferase n=1 Tax=Corynebacterium TaxID=1716 RepID=UPI00124D02BC|nr:MULTISPECIES: phosphoribosylglycinamide formyltransferase [Corynebacterium]MBV7301915.1 phosphoribosylglycinamide formyltransferase [Corynebacterium sp. TAE3-ERU2]
MRIVILASGSGTLAQAIMDAQDESYRVCGLVADCECQALERARTAGVQAELVPFRGGAERDHWNRDLAQAVAALQPDFVVSAGFMRILSPEFLERFPRRVINTHPALLPAFPGAHAVRDALNYGVKVTGSTVHYVDEGVDTGEIIEQRPVAVHADDTEASLHERIKVVERQAIVDVLHTLSRS